MNMKEIACDIAIVGGGPAGLAAAAAAKEHGAEEVLVIERDRSFGGILQQCIHPGFGLSYYNEELTGPEYASRFLARAESVGVKFIPETMVLEVDPGTRSVIGVNPRDGMVRILAKSIVLAMGCRERTRGNIRIPGDRPAGIYTAGAAQRLINRQNRMIGRKVVIVGSGDIGMIMARRLTLEGAEVAAVVEWLPYIAGLRRNRVQCLDDFSIPLLLSHTVSAIRGRDRVEGVEVAAVDENRRIRPETRRVIPCDTLLLSVGLIPENELTRDAGIELDPATGGARVNQYMQTSVPAVFAAGNVLHVNDLVDNVSRESETAGIAAARFAAGTLPEFSGEARCLPGGEVRYVCPQKLALPGDGRVTLCFRVSRPLRAAHLCARCGDREIAARDVERVNPGEMECLMVDPADIVSDTVTVEASGEEFRS